MVAPSGLSLIIGAETCLYHGGSYDVFNGLHLDQGFGGEKKKKERKEKM